MNTAPDRSACDPVIYWQSRFELMSAENVRLEHRNAELVAALEKLDSNCAESPEWIRRVARAALAKTSEASSFLPAKAGRQS